MLKHEKSFVSFQLVVKVHFVAFFDVLDDLAHRLNYTDGNIVPILRIFVNKWMIRLESFLALGKFH